MQHQKPKKTITKKRKKSNRSSALRSEMLSYQPNNDLTKYVEKVCGINYKKA
jgi:hypothetical protein